MGGIMLTEIEFLIFKQIWKGANNSNKIIKSLDYQVSYSSILRALKKLSHLGLINEASRGGFTNRMRVFYLTSKGKGAFNSLINQEIGSKVID